MSYRQRIVPLFIATFVGVVSGVYVFDPLLKQYAIDSRGTFDPKVAQAGLTGGVGGGVNDPDRVGGRQDKADKAAMISGPEARQKLKEALDAGRQGQSSQAAATTQAK